MKIAMPFFIILVLLLPLFSNSQLIGLEIKDFDSKKPISAATVSYKNKPIAKSDVHGKATVSLDYKIVMVYAMGFDSAEVVLGGSNQIVYLYKKDNKLKEVVVKPWVDTFANELIRKMMAAAKNLHPDRLASYQFYTYSKFVADANEDTAKNVLSKEDSLEFNETSRYIKNNKLFVWERLTVFKHDKKLGTKKVLLNSNMSGFKMPIYELLALTLDEVNFLPRMFRSDGYKDYYFRLEDSTEIAGRKVYQVAFYPFKRSKNKRSRHGYVRIDAENFACMAYKGTTKQGYFELTNQLIDGKVFSKDIFVNLTSSMIEMVNMNTNLIYKLNVQNVEVPKTFTKNDFRGYDSEISTSLNDSASYKMLSKVRGTDSLDARERNTFVSLDSVMKKNNAASKIRLLLALRSGNLKLGAFNLDILDFMQFNRYEGFRLNVGGETNYSFHPKLALRGKLGYGFGDQRFKYQLGASYLLHYQNNSKISILYENEVFPVGRPFHSLSSKMDYFNHLVNVWFFDKFYHTQNLKVSFQSDLHKYLEQKVSVQYENLTVLFPYQFQVKNIVNTHFLNSSLELNYYPETKFIVTPEGKFKLRSKPTLLKLNYTFRQPVNSSFTAFHTVYLEGQTRIKTPLGRTDFTAIVHYIQGDAPIFSLMEGMGSSNRNFQLISTFGLGSYRYFETMEPSRFYSDKTAAIFIKHHLPEIAINPRRDLKLSLIYKALIGHLERPSEHSVAIEAPTKLYQETGLEWDQIIGKLPIGLGFYYRFGAYYSGNFGDNFATRLVFNL